MTAVAGVDQPVGFLALGGNRLGSALDEEQSFRLLDDFHAHGGVMIDTALVYADWVPTVERACSERVIGRWLRSRGVADEMVVTTKGGHPDLGDPAGPRLGAAELRADVERSRQNLGLETLPLWWLHRDDPLRPVEEIVASVQALVDEGLVGAWGVCNWTAGRLAAACEAADAQSRPGPVADSACFALAPPAPGAMAADLVTLNPELSGLHEQSRMPLVAYSAQAKGWFDKLRRTRQTRQTELDPIFDTPTGRAAATAVWAMAEELGISPTELALAALRLLPFPTVAVVGPGTVQQLASCRVAAAVDLTGHEATLRGLLDAAIGAVPNAGSAERTDG